jgi:hypothetical protein
MWTPFKILKKTFVVSRRTEQFVVNTVEEFILQTHELTEGDQDSSEWWGLVW